MCFIQISKIEITFNYKDNYDNDYLKKMDHTTAYPISSQCKRSGETLTHLLQQHGIAAGDGDPGLGMGLTG
jgi:hypothetical protein